MHMAWFKSIILLFVFYLSCQFFVFSFHFCFLLELVVLSFYFISFAFVIVLLHIEFFYILYLYSLKFSQIRITTKSLRNFLLASQIQRPPCNLPPKIILQLPFNTKYVLSTYSVPRCQADYRVGPQAHGIFTPALRWLSFSILQAVQRAVEWDEH